MFSPSGGGIYHWRAITRRNLWRPFTSALATWLESWPVGNQELLLIGPSGGHTLPSRWLEKFANITAVDVDPLAGPLFRLKHRRAKVHFQRRDVFFENRKLAFEPLRQLRAENSNAAILFCNVLGQLPLENRCSEAEWLEFLGCLPRALGSAPWASYHDAYTLEGLPYRLHSVAAEPFLKGGSIEDVAATLGERSTLIYDHMTTGDWATQTTKTRWSWSLTSSSLHLLEAVFSNPAGRAT